MLTKDKIEGFYTDVEALRLKYPVAAISKATGEGKGNVSKYLNRKLEPSESFLNRFYEHFPKSSKNVSREIEDITQDRYLKLLEDNDKFFKNLIKTNLGTAEVVQAAILAHLKAMVQADAEEKSGGDKRKQERMLSAWNRRIAENLGLLEKKDSYSTVDR